MLTVYDIWIGCGWDGGMTWCVWPLGDVAVEGVEGVVEACGRLFDGRMALGVWVGESHVRL